MRLLKLTLLSLFATAGTTLVHATPVPVGTYTLFAQTTTTGIHQSPDQGTLTGTMTFDASNLLTANLTFHDVTSGLNFSFTKVGPTTMNAHPPLEGATISNAFDPTIYYVFSILLPSNPSGTFTLTCGTDCDNFLDINDGAGIVYEEVTGFISPAATPEPSSLLLLGTGVLGALGVARRRWLKR